MSTLVDPRRLEAALLKYGLVPGDCRRAEVVIEPGAVAVIRYEVFVTIDKIAALGMAFAEAGVIS